MRIKADDKIWANVDDYWESRAMSPELLNAARLDPSLWPEQADRIAQFPVTAVTAAKSWATAQRMALFQQGTGALGLSASSLVTVASGMAPLVLSPPTDLNTLGVALGQTAIGVTVDLLGAVPVIGPIAQAIGSFAMFLVGLAKMKPAEAVEYLPPEMVFLPEAEETVMNRQVLPALVSADWTNLFLPRQSNDPSLTELKTGWLLTSAENTRAEGTGFLPGTQSIHSAVQALWHSKSKRAGESSAVSQDTGDFFPSSAQLLTALESQIQRPSAALWSVDTKKILDGWKAHHAAVMSFVMDLWNNKGTKGTGLDKLNEEQRRIVLRALVAPMHVGTLPTGEPRRGVLNANSWTPKASTRPDNVIEAFVQPWCDALKARQRFFLDTTAVAYADPKSAAFQDKTQRDMLEKNRALLVKSPARWKVAQQDVVDPVYRAQLFKATIGDTLKDPSSNVAVPAVPPRLDGSSAQPPAPTAPQGGAPFEGIAADLVGEPADGRGGGIVLSIGLAALGFIGWQRLRRRRRR